MLVHLGPVGCAALAAASEAWGAFVSALEHLLGDWLDELVCKAVTDVLCTTCGRKLMHVLHCRAVR
eukprot:SAG11_NODE_1201_length_5538_cov_2.793896_2_plen_66_part_00